MLQSTRLGTMRRMRTERIMRKALKTRTARSERTRFDWMLTDSKKLSNEGSAIRVMMKSNLFQFDFQYSLKPSSLILTMASARKNKVKKESMKMKMFVSKL